MSHSNSCQLVGCHVSQPDHFLCARNHTYCGHPYRLQPPLPCPHSPNQLVSFRVLARSADRADLVHCDMTTDADTRVSNQTLLSPLCLCYRYAPYCTARTTHRTAVAHVLRLLPHLFCTCPAATHVLSRSTVPTSAFCWVLLLTMLTLLLMTRLLRQGHRKHLQSVS